MLPATCMRIGALLAALAVGLGAFAAHGMKAHFDAAALTTFETGVRYQMYHALAICLCGLLLRHGWRTARPAACFVAGCALFSGSLYLLVLTDVRWLGAITPIGGVAFLLGWLLLAIGRAPQANGPQAGGPPAER
jgi:uncharacterized membrane protein YgdD (TMEM256/DUF423 family)